MRRRRGGLALVQELGRRSGVTLFVGLQRGTEKRNTVGRCAALPQKFRVKQVFETFQRLRERRVPRAVAGTATVGKGWWESVGEPSVQIRVDLGTPGNERKWGRFCSNVTRLAEDLAGVLCQDAVYVVREHRDRQWAATVSVEEGRASNRELAAACRVPPLYHG